MTLSWLPFLLTLSRREFIGMELTAGGEKNSERTNGGDFYSRRRRKRNASRDTHESEFSLSVSDSSLRCDFHFLYLSIRSIRYEFFFAFLINWNFSSSFAVGLYTRTNTKIDE